MKKIPCLFQRGADRFVIDAITHGCEWVLEGEGWATEKYDGTACMVHNGTLFRWRGERYMGKTLDVNMRWAPIDPVGDDDRWHREAWHHERPGWSGTYELVGPKVQGNPYGLEHHVLWLHGVPAEEPPGPRTFASIRDWLQEREDMEGIVYHREAHGGDMAKIRRKDFGFPWPVKP